jgi:hypothetical protein
MLQSTTSAPYAKKPIPPADFLPKWGAPKTQTEEDRAKGWEASAAMFRAMALGLMAKG